MKTGALVVLALSLAFASCERKQAAETPSMFAAIDQLMQKREHERAIELLEELRLQQGAEPGVALRLVQAYAGAGDMSKAMLRCKEGLERHPESAALNLALGQIYSRVSYHEHARDAFAKARELGLGDDVLALPYALALGQVNDLDGADRELERARAAGADANVVDYNLALVRTQQKRFPEAKKLLESVLAKDPKYASAQRELARVLMVLYPDNRESLNRAMGLLWDAKDQLPSDWRLLEIMGDGWLLLGDYEAALTAYTDALRLGENPQSVEDKYVVAKRAQMSAAAQAQAPAKPN